MISTQYNDNHFKINEKNNRVYLNDARGFESVDELIAHYETNRLGQNLPSNLIQIVRRPIKRNMVVVRRWQARSGMELTLKVGDVISVLKDDGDWWVGLSSIGKQGYFPGNYVE